MLALWTIFIAIAPNLVGFVLPPAIQLLNKDVPDGRERFILTLIICILTGGVLHFSQLVFGNPDQALGSIALLFSESQVIYRLYFKDKWEQGTGDSAKP